MLTLHNLTITDTALNREDPINPDTREIIVSLQRRF